MNSRIWEPLVWFSNNIPSENTPTYIIYFSLLVIIIIVLQHIFKKKHHGHKIRTADYVLNRIKDFNDAQKIAYLRKIDPYSFEELILTCLERKGFPIRRNKRYSGDGGVDGRFFIDGKVNLIQAKRYSGDIRYDHLREFSALLIAHNCHGIFVHTGKTPKNIFQKKIDMSKMTIISGSRLIKLLDIEIKKTI